MAVFRLGILSVLFLWSMVPVFGEAGEKNNSPTLFVADMTAPPPTLDPFKVYGTQAQSLLRQIFGNLVDRDENGRLIPAIAKKWIYRGGNVWRLKIRKGVYFQDGERLTNRDIKFSLERLIGPSSVRPRRRDFSFISKVEIKDDDIVDIRTKGPAPTLPARLAQFGMPVPIKKLNQLGERKFFISPIGAGPYRLIGMDERKAVLVRHDKYYRGPSKVKRIEFQFIENPRQRLDLLFSGKLDLVTNILPGFSKEIAENPRSKLVKKRSLQFNHIVFDTLSPGPLRDRRIRRALAYWTNVPSLIRYVAHGNGHPIPTPVMPQDFGFNKDVKPYPFRPKLAKKLIQEAGYPSGFNLSAVTSDEMAPLSKAVAKQWQRLGVNLKIQVVSRAEAIRLWARTRKFQVFFFSPTNLLQDASFHLKILLDSKHPMNRFNLASITELAQKVDQIENLKKRRDLLSRLQDIVVQELPSLTFYQQVKIYALSNRVNGFQGYPDTILRFHNTNISPSRVSGTLSSDK